MHLARDQLLFDLQNDLNHIDYLGRFETFEEDLTEVMDIIGIEAIIKKKNASKRKKDYREGALGTGT